MRRRASTGRLRDQSGIGVMLVMGIGLLVMGMAFVAQQIFDGAITSSEGHVNYEDALHLAEQGVDRTLAEVQKDRSYSNAGAMPAGVVSGASERAWVIGQINAALPLAAPGGQYVAVKPSNRNVVYGAAWIPDRAHAKATRIVKAEYLLSAFNPTEAVLSAADLRIQGSPVISGAGGNVHSNGNLSNSSPDLDVIGSPDISGSATTAGQLASSGNPRVGGLFAGGQPSLDIPVIDPREVWNRHAKSPEYTGDWYDLCPDDTVRTPDGPTPCAGTVVGGDGFRGWKASGSSWDFTGNDGTYTGVYYAYHRSLRVTGHPGTPGNPWRTTLIAEGLGCPAPGDADIEVSGTPDMSYLIDGMAIFAGRDVKISGDATIVGFIGAHEQFEVPGNATITGSILGEDACSSSGTSEDQIQGNAKIVYDGRLEIPFGTVIRTTLWLEI